MNARETLDRHGGYALARNWDALGADFTPDALQEAAAQGIRPPRGASKYEVVGESQEGDDYVFDVKYSSDTESSTIRSRWRKLGEDWKIVKAEMA